VYVKRLDADRAIPLTEIHVKDSGANTFRPLKDEDVSLRPRR
jgi:hypothetical protein